MLGTAATRGTDSTLPLPQLYFQCTERVLVRAPPPPPNLDVEIASKLSLFSILMAGPVFLSSFPRGHSRHKLSRRAASVPPFSRLFSATSFSFLGRNVETR